MYERALHWTVYLIHNCRVHVPEFQREMEAIYITVQRKMILPWRLYVLMYKKSLYADICKLLYKIIYLYRYIDVCAMYTVESVHSLKRLPIIELF